MERLAPLVPLTALALSGLLFTMTGVHAVDGALPGQIMDFPYSKTNAFSKPHELQFVYPDDGLARAEFRSDAFYAIILVSAQRCSLMEEDRLEAQASFPQNKVFMDRFNCMDDVEENITYTNVNEKYSFIAVHAGNTKEDAIALLGRPEIASRFPGANIRLMQAVLVFP